MSRIPIKNKNFYTRDGFAIVSLGWILVSIFGALPFVISGAIPSFADAFLKQYQALLQPARPFLVRLKAFQRAFCFGEALLIGLEEWEFWL